MIELACTMNLGFSKAIAEKKLEKIQAEMRFELVPHRSQLQNFRGFFFPVDESDQFVGGNDVIQKSFEKSLFLERILRKIMFKNNVYFAYLQILYKIIFKLFANYTRNKL